MRPGKRILVIEDEAVIRDFLCDLLTSAGYEVSCCEDGSSALKAASHGIFDVIITDYDMPAMNGAKLANIFRTQLPSSIIIGVSSIDRKEDFLNSGADAFLQKPYSCLDLIALINQEITYSLLE